MGRQKNFKSPENNIPKKYNYGNNIFAKRPTSLSSSSAQNSIDIENKVYRYLKESDYANVADISLCCTVVKVMEQIFDEHEKESLNILRNKNIFKISKETEEKDINKEIHINKTTEWKKMDLKINIGEKIKCPNMIDDENKVSNCNILVQKFDTIKDNGKTVTPEISKVINVPTVPYKNYIPNESKCFITTSLNFKTEDKPYYDYVCNAIIKENEESINSKDEENLEDLFPEGVRGTEDDIFERKFTPEIIMKGVESLTKLFPEKSHDEILQNIVYIYPSIGPLPALKIDLKSYEIEMTKKTFDVFENFNMCPRCQLLSGCNCNKKKPKGIPHGYIHENKVKLENPRPCSKLCWLLQTNMKRYTYKENDFPSLTSSKIRELYILFGNKPCLITSDIVEFSKIDIECFKVAKYIEKHLQNTPCKEYFVLTKDQETPIPYKKFYKNISSYLKSDGTVNNMVIYNPCCHTGPCTKENKCPCAINKHICYDSCGCPPNCKTKFTGCHCKAGDCSTTRCPCFILGWECLPMTCDSCSFDGIKKKDCKSCQNCFIQRNLCKNIDIKQSPIAGNGAFAGESILKGEFIIEYKGEVISNEEAERRGRICDAKKSSYLFVLNEDEHIDALNYGNSARFINHSSDNPNCAAKVMIVNGNHRIGLYATKNISKGEELLFDYRYTNQHKKGFIEKPNKNGS
ncbi:Histone-lysine N-methyltransferase EZH2 [Strongyloides ratti]|uniref:[histone H3]-lysine(27) N-trimethyltransferase n=1 Tax=Strongyloides ratti TaxID=34506 RepID=A0A090LTX8_STRRB|nr:Histone-lysine N-methyltransferase EZH2 [Strongyloides ratti]CEF71099.1 Histone-lysine N-methyltransferase EZH2 [Strongyloides ratti]